VLTVFVRRLWLLIALAAIFAAPADAAPRAVDFERSLSAGTARAASATVEAGRFDVVGLRWAAAPAEPHVRLRVRVRGAWKRWVEVPASHSRRGSDPVLAPGADALQLRGTRGIRGLRLHFVRVTGARRRAVRARAAQSGPPPIIGRDQWEAGQCPPRDGPTMGRVQMAFVHHTVSANDYRPEDSAAMVLGICRFHRNSNGWDDLGYNFLVDKYGQVFEGRAGGIDQPVVGAQAQGWNSESTGIANLGTYQDVPQTDQALAAMAQLIAWKLPLHGAPVTGTVTLTSGGGSSNRYPAGRTVTYERISGHRDGNSTACPGEQLYLQLPRLRDMAAGRAPAVIGPGPAVGAASTLTLAAQRTALSFPEPVRVGGRLADPSGAGLAGVRVRIQVLTSLGFKAVAQAFTDPAGNYSAEMPTTRNRTVRALVGNIASAPVKVAVAPSVGVRAGAKRVLAGRRAVLTGAVRPKKAVVIVQLARQVGTARFVRVAALRFKTRDGRYRAAVPLRRPGLYRLRVTFRGDRRNAPGRGPDAYVRAVRKLTSVRAVRGAR
jgi:N-acetylmuramoyl-L-alanine amidase